METGADDRIIIHTLARAAREFDRVRERLIVSDEPSAERVVADASAEAAGQEQEDAERKGNRFVAGLSAIAEKGAALAGKGAALAVGKVHPRHENWEQADVDTRVEWWTDRLGTAVAAMAALPSYLGALASRTGVVDAIGAAGQLLVIYAIAHEVGEEETADQVVVGARIVLGREYTREQVVQVLGDAEGEDVTDIDEELDEPPSEDPPGLIRKVGRGALLVRRVARQIRSLGDALDERPQGGFITRTLANVPGLGLAGGFLAERSGVKQAAEEAREAFGLTV